MYNLILAVAAANDKRQAAICAQAIIRMMRSTFLFIAQSAQPRVVLASLRRQVIWCCHMTQQENPLHLLRRSLVKRAERLKQRKRS
jgi:hypothetical protein